MWCWQVRSIGSLPPATVQGGSTSSRWHGLGHAPSHTGRMVRLLSPLCGALALWTANVRDRGVTRLRSVLLRLSVWTCCLACPGSSGNEHTMMLTAAGEVFTCGNGAYGVLGHGSRSSESVAKRVTALVGVPIVHLSAGGYHSLAVTRSGLAYSWGRCVPRARCSCRGSVELGYCAGGLPWTVMLLSQAALSICGASCDIMRQ